MRLRPPVSTRTSTLFPYTTLFLSVAAVVAAHAVLVIVVLGIAAQVLAHALAHLVDVVGVNAGQPEVGRDRGLLALQPDDLTQALRGIDTVHLVAPLPDAFVDRKSTRLNSSH